MPNICKLSPGNDLHAEDLDMAGGIPAVMKEISGLLNLDEITVTGKQIGEVISSARVKDKKVIRPFS